MKAPDLRGKVAIVTGGSRGIGREIALALARAGCDICVAAKSTSSTALLPGSIGETAEEIRALGRRAIAVQTNVRETAALERMVATTVDELGGVDILINNAGALWWKNVFDTPPNRFDLVLDVNARASFVASHLVLPQMIARGGGHIVMMSPPIDLAMVPGKVAYCISKFGMTLIAHGLAAEVRQHGIAVNALWPATLIESQATINYGMGSAPQWRKPSILADACLAVLSRSASELSGRALIDEDVLRDAGVTDFSVYNCTPDGQPLRIVGSSDDAASDAPPYHGIGGSTRKP